MTTPDQGWDSYLKEAQRHGLPIPPDAPTNAGPAATSNAQVPAALASTSNSAVAPAGAETQSVTSGGNAPSAPSVASQAASVFDPSGAGGTVVTFANMLGNWGSVFGDATGSATINVGQATYASYGWNIVPSATNEYGPGLAAHEFKIDLAGDVLQDWYFV